MYAPRPQMQAHTPIINPLPRQQQHTPTAPPASRTRGGGPASLLAGRLHRSNAPRHTLSTAARAAPTPPWPPSRSCTHLPPPTQGTPHCSHQGGRELEEAARHSSSNSGSGRRTGQGGSEQAPPPLLLARSTGQVSQSVWASGGWGGAASARPLPTRSKEGRGGGGLARGPTPPPPQQGGKVGCCLQARDRVYVELHGWAGGWVGGWGPWACAGMPVRTCNAVPAPHYPALPPHPRPPPSPDKVVGGEAPNGQQVLVAAASVGRGVGGGGREAVSHLSPSCWRPRLPPRPPATHGSQGHLSIT